MLRGLGLTFSLVTLLSSAAFALAAESDPVSRKTIYDGSFNSNGKVKIICAEQYESGHFRQTISYEWATSKGELLAGEISDGMTDNVCAGFKKVEAKGSQVFLHFEDRGSRYETFESPLQCVRPIKWISDKKRFEELKAECKTAAWQIKNRKAHDLFKKIVRKIRLGDFDALTKLSKADTGFLKERLHKSSERFLFTYGEEMKTAALAYIDDLVKNKKPASKIFSARLNYVKMYDATAEWFSKICPESESNGCYEEHEDSPEASRNEMLEKTKKELLVLSFAPQWLEVLEKMKSEKSPPVLGLTREESVNEIDDLFDKDGAGIRPDLRLKLADIAEKDKEIYYAKYLIAAAQANQCEKIPRRVWKVVSDTYEPEKMKEEDFKAEEWGLDDSLKRGAIDSASSSILRIVVGRAYQKKCGLISPELFKRYFKQGEPNE